MSDSISLATTSFPTVRGNQSGSMLPCPPMFPDLSREELERLRMALQTESTSFDQLPRLIPDLALPNKNSSQLAFRCVKIVKKSPRRSLIPQTDWLKLIADGNDGPTSESTVHPDPLQETKALSSNDLSQPTDQRISSIETEEANGESAPCDRRNAIHNETKINCSDENHLHP
ncbi:uncharacterized protein MELLADRAFT_84842 [Melampsora larici-populina 98AG31]|uniref:Uncharacterized protein n=1 Tax=Melampsora larici-populina (strain 98AG31 / pathotype 3-4-7) TaxID=747676 RepID=F4SCN8_MELLP|nr:uncharacterized protein MELLADRAFT_84842 [Melampsora larici-populina 98AG31]EGF97591.1 hypothetical protein MELLADRAFT_84842 [Melampsora larici-populina 98AG31]